jgi:carboxymethylenebutenolidase
MIVTTETLDLGGVRTTLARPRAPGRFPCVIAYSDIFQGTPPHLRLVERLAGHGFVVASPSLYGSLGAPDALDFEGGRERALELSARVRVEDLDADRGEVLAALRARDDVGSIGALGFCFGGHLAFRAALEPEVKAAVCCYPTGIHSDKLGSGEPRTLARCAEIRGDLSLIWGRNDPHIPAEGRAKIHHALDEAGVRWEARLYDAEHAFMRDVGPRWDPEASDRAFGAIVGLFQRTLRAS